jgi:hypothetical protein
VVMDRDRTGTPATPPNLALVSRIITAKPNQHEISLSRQQFLSFSPPNGSMSSLTHNDDDIFSSIGEHRSWRWLKSTAMLDALGARPKAPRSGTHPCDAPFPRDDGPANIVWELPLHDRLHQLLLTLKLPADIAQPSIHVGLSHS